MYLWQFEGDSFETVLFAREEVLEESKNPPHKEEYTKVIVDYIQQNHVAKI